MNIALPLTRLIKRFEPVEGCVFIFSCEKEGKLITKNGNIPLKCLYFMIPYNREYLSMSQIDMQNLDKYKELFVFEILVGGTPATRDVVGPYRRKLLDCAKKYGTFGQTMVNPMYIDEEKMLEYTPAAENPLSCLELIPPAVRQELLLPYPLEADDKKILLIGKIIYFDHTPGILVFAEANPNENLIIVRHYISSDAEQKIPSLRLYVEITRDGKYKCRFNLDEEEFFRLGKHTIYGYASLATISGRVYSLDVRPLVEAVNKCGFGCNNKTQQSERIKSKHLYGFGDENEDEDDFFKVGITDDRQLEQWQDQYGGYQ